MLCLELDGEEFAFNTGDLGSIPGLGRAPGGGGNGNPLQYSCLENPMDRGAWWGYRLWGCRESDMTELTKHPRVPFQIFFSPICNLRSLYHCISFPFLPFPLNHPLLAAIFTSWIRRVIYIRRSGGTLFEKRRICYLRPRFWEFVKIKRKVSVRLYPPRQRFRADLSSWLPGMCIRSGVGALLRLISVLGLRGEGGPPYVLAVWLTTNSSNLLMDWVVKIWQCWDAFELCCRRRLIS